MDKLDIKLPYHDFFAQYAEKSHISTFGKQSRDCALNYVTDIKEVIDIGAHVGISVRHFAKIFNRVHAFEPMHTHFECLQENTKDLNNVTLYNFAISNVEKKTKGAYRTNKNTGSFQLLDENFDFSKNKKTREIYEIQSCILDNIEFESVGLIKIDVEGWEYEVLLGSKETILKHSPVLLVEFTGGNSKKSLHSYDIEKYNQLINELGYKAINQIDDDTIYIKECK